MLSAFANNVYDKLWFERGGPKNIYIVDLNFGCENSQHLQDILFGNPVERAFDGNHFRGSGGTRHLTYRAVSMIRPIIGQCSAKSMLKNSRNFHAECIQSRQHRQSHPDHSEENINQFIFPKKFKKSSHSSSAGFTFSKQGSNYYSIPVQNRFSENC